MIGTPVASTDFLPIDPEILQLLLTMAEGAPPPDASVAQMREAQLRTARLMSPGPSLGRVIDVELADGRGTLPGRLYFGSGSPSILMLFLHGGGWILGGRDVSDAAARRIAAGTGTAVLTIDYRLAPEHPFPAAIDDAHRAILWAARHAASLTGSDETKIVIAGESAGANLAAGVTILARASGPAIHAQILSCPVLDSNLDTPFVRDTPAPFPPRDLLPFLFKSYAPDQSIHDDPLFAPLRADDLSGLPPALIFTVELDVFREQGEAYHERLKDAGVPCEIIRHTGTLHGFLEMDNGHRQSQAAIGAMHDFLGRYVPADAGA